MSGYKTCMGAELHFHRVWNLKIFREMGPCEALDVTILLTQPIDQ